MKQTLLQTLQTDYWLYFVYSAGGGGGEVLVLHISVLGVINIGPT
jgi:hypothetical protein